MALLLKDHQMGLINEWSGISSHANTSQNLRKPGPVDNHLPRFLWETPGQEREVFIHG